MKSRCYDSSDKAYKNYGGRGIKVCARWLESFENFLEDMGVCPPGLTIERMDNDGDYTPDNCKWATYREQANNRRSNISVMYDGEPRNLEYLANIAGIPIKLLWSRLHRQNWSIERALFTPSMYKGGN
jgi:hypothetical protein